MVIISHLQGKHEQKIRLATYSPSLFLSRSTKSRTTSSPSFVLPPTSLPGTDYTIFLNSRLLLLGTCEQWSWIEDRLNRTYFSIIFDMIPHTDKLRIQLVEHTVIVTIFELLLDVEFDQHPSLVQVQIIFQVWFSPIERIKRRHVRYVILQIASGRLKVLALCSLDKLHHDFLCTFYRRFILLHGIPKVDMEFILRGRETSDIRHLYY